MKKATGKRLMWSDHGCLAVARVANNVCADPAVRSGQTKVNLGRCIISAFINDNCRPEDACKTEGMVQARTSGNEMVE